MKKKNKPDKKLDICLHIHSFFIGWTNIRMIIIQCIRKLDPCTLYKKFLYLQIQAIIEPISYPINEQNKHKIFSTNVMQCQVHSIFRFKISCHFQAKCRFFTQKINKQESWFFFVFGSFDQKQKMEWTGQKRRNNQFDKK